MAKDATGVTVSTSSVTITSALIQSIKHVPGTFHVTPLQPRRSAPKVQRSAENPHAWTITVECGLQASAEMAKDFNRYAGGAAHEYTATNSGSPQELDFYFEVELTLRMENAKSPVKLWLGQAGSGATATWWLGGDLILNHGDPMLLLITKHKYVKVLLLSGTNDSFTLTLVSS